MSIRHASLSHSCARFSCWEGESHRMTKICTDKPAVTRCSPFSPLYVCCLHFLVQPRPASGARVGGHGAGGEGAVHLRMGLLHSADCVHSQGRAHARHRLPGLRPRGTGTAHIRHVFYTSPIAPPSSFFFLPLSASFEFIIIQYGDIKGSPLLLTNYRCWKCHQKAALHQTSLPSCRVASATRLPVSGFWMTHLWSL